MAEFNLEKFKTHYILPPARYRESERLDGLRLTVLDEAFQSIRDRAGMPRDGELCIRSVSVPVRIRLNNSDQSIVASWSSAVTDNLVRLIGSSASDGFIFYYSRHHALFDFVVAVSRENYQRSWAWQLIGIMRSKPSSDGDALIQMVEALCREPELIVPALQVLAASGDLRRLARRLSGAQWIELAEAAQSTVEVTVAPRAHAQPASPRTFQRALRVLRRSRVLAAVVSSSTITSADESVRRAIAALAVLEVEPALLRSEAAGELLDVVSASFTLNASQSLPSTTQPDLFGERRGDETRDEVSVAATEVARKADLETQVPKRGKDARLARQSALQSNFETEALKQGKERQWGEFDEAPGHDQKREPLESAKAHLGGAFDNALDIPDKPSSWLESLGDRQTEITEGNEVVVPRRNAFTQFGGVLFLINLLAALKLPDEILNDEALGARPLGWTLHALALELIPANEDDAAVLAFAGLLPDAKPPSQQEPPKTEIESASLARFHRRIIDRLCDVIDNEHKSVGELIQFVCCRRAQIVSDPAWIEIKFSLDEVATEIRRAGLDLDPGYVSWLGVVFRFVYE